MSSKLRWDIFCKVVDNFGDIGVCWRLCVNLASRGHMVRLWVDDASALAWMAPQGCNGVEVLECRDEQAVAKVYASNRALRDSISDVLVDTFGCDFAIYLIANYAINTSTTIKNDTKNQPVWLNLEYLTAESFAERAHTLPSPQHTGAAAGWTQRYFYPGFNERTGGLLGENDLFERQKTFNKGVWLSQLLAAEQHTFNQETSYISLFCYEPVALEALIDQLVNAKTPTCLLVTAGRAAAAVKSVLEHKKSTEPSYLINSLLSILFIQHLTQLDYDHLLWSCDLNFVRGEDSLVRAIWAAKPFIWQIYPQEDGAHHAKLNAFLEMMNAPASLKLAHSAWNASQEEQTASRQGLKLPALELQHWAQSAQNLRKKLQRQDDLVSNLVHFVSLCRENS